MRMSDVDAIVTEFLLTDDAGTGRFDPPGGPGTSLRGTEVLPGLLYHYPQIDVGRDRSAVTLQIFLGIGDLGTQLWDQEVKVLMRVNSLQHPALPNVLDRGHLDAAAVGATVDGAPTSVAYMRTSADTAISADNIADLIALMRSDKIGTLRQFWLLADALAILHDTRIVHRTCGPARFRPTRRATRGRSGSGTSR